MMEKIRLGDLVNTSSGATPLSSNKEYYENGDIPWINSGEVGQYKINFAEKFITKEGFEKSNTKIFPKDTILVAMYGATAGKTSILNINACTNQAVCAILPSENVNNIFLKYKLDSIYDYLVQISSGSARDNLSQKVIQDLEINLPLLETQQKIAKILSDIDDKIEVLHQINDNLAELAKTIYDYWFVQFDFPDENGKPYKSSGGKMVYNNVLKREIPEGWEVKRIGEFIDLERGVTYTKENISEKSFQNIGVLRATNISGNKIDLNNLVYISNKLKDSQILKQFDTLIVMSSGSKEHIGKNGIYYFSEQNAFGAFCAKIRAKEKMVFEFINVFLQSESFKVYIKNQCLGTNINNLNNTHILLCPILKPADNILELYHYNTKNIFQKIAYNTQQIQHLQSLRDWLLPMLMNGQISVE